MMTMIRTYLRSRATRTTTTRTSHDDDALSRAESSAAKAARTKKPLLTKAQEEFWSKFLPQPAKAAAARAAPTFKTGPSKEGRGPSRNYKPNGARKHDSSSKTARERILYVSGVLAPEGERSAHFVETRLMRWPA